MDGLMVLDSSSSSSLTREGISGMYKRPSLLPFSTMPVFPLPHTPRAMIPLTSSRWYILNGPYRAPHGWHGGSTGAGLNWGSSPMVRRRYDRQCQASPQGLAGRVLDGMSCWLCATNGPADDLPGDSTRGCAGCVDRELARSPAIYCPVAGRAGFVGAKYYLQFRYSPIFVCLHPRRLPLCLPPLPGTASSLSSLISSVPVTPSHSLLCPHTFDSGSSSSLSGPCLLLPPSFFSITSKSGRPLPSQPRLCPVLCTESQQQHLHAISP